LSERITRAACRLVVQEMSLPSCAKLVIIGGLEATKAPCMEGHARSSQWNGWQSGRLVSTPPVCSKTLTSDSNSDSTRAHAFVRSQVRVREPMLWEGAGSEAMTPHIEPDRKPLRHLMCACMLLHMSICVCVCVHACMRAVVRYSRGAAVRMPCGRCLRTVPRCPVRSGSGSASR
jgi:hypothetical protein